MARRKKAEVQEETIEEVLEHFDPLEGEEEIDAEMDMMNDPSVTHLPDHHHVGGVGWSSQHDVFSESSVNTGTSAASPLFSHAAAFPQAKQLRVWQVVEGVEHGLGVVGIHASEEEFVRKFLSAMPGRFKLRPIDVNGRYVGQEFTLVISEHHSALARVRGAGAPASTQPHMGEHMFAFMEKMNQAQETRIQRLLEQLESERNTVSSERAELAEERIALASNAASGVQAVSERMMQSDQARQDQITQTLTGIFNQQIQMMQMTGESERQRHQQAMDRLRQEQTFSIERERDRVTREREREREWNVERQKERDRRSDAERDELRQRERLRKNEMDLSLQREREHAERMMSLQKTDGALGPVKKLLGEFGMKPMDVIEMMRGNNDAADPTLGTTIVKGITEVGKSFADAAKSNVEAQAQVAQAQAVALQAQAQLPYYEDEEGPAEPEQEPLEAGARYSTQNPAVAQAFSADAPPPTQAAPVGPAQTTKINLPLPVLRRARKAVRDMIGRCMAAPEPQWEEIITTGIMSEVSVIDYVAAASMRRALIECGADAAFAQRMIAAIDSSGLVPEGIPRG